jgi:O-antigen ligase/tetratricopeptide (TPR) repeat protein
MPNLSKQSRHHRSFSATPGRWWKNLAVAMIPVLACFLGGATEKWTEGIVICLLGLLLLVAPPRVSLGAALNGIMLALIACAATAFLPAHWFFQPAWRLALTNDFGINLPATLSPQPWISLGCVISFVAGLTWLYYVSTLDLELGEVRYQLRLFAGGIVLLAALSIILHAAHTALPFWHNPRGFGPFPNRNQTANLFGLTAIVILACGQDDIRHGNKRWIVWLLGLMVLTAAIVLDFSRAGILILVVGTATWLGLFALRKRSTAGIALGLSVLLVLLTVVLIFGGQTLERFHLRSGAMGDTPADLRWLIFRDALHLIQASPWCGIGLGNFDEIFAMFRNASLTTARAIHPESDWFWLGAELGWPAVFLTAVGIALFLRRVFPLREGTNQRFRLAALIAAVLFALHGLMDVSGHRIGTAFSGIFLLGLAIRRPAQFRSSRWAPAGFRLLGLALFVVAATWVIASRYEMSLPGIVGVENEKRLASIASSGHNFGETIVRTTRALRWAPLSWQLYFLRALAEAGLKQSPNQAIDDFRRARYLEPSSVEVPFQEGTVWREALRRAGSRRAEFFGYMLSLATQYSPEVLRRLEEFGPAQPDLALVYLERASSPRFNPILHRVLEYDPNLQTFSSEEKIRLFSLWAQHGDPDELSRTIETHPEWLQQAWLALAKYHASKGDFRSAFELARRFGTPPTLPQITVDTSLEDLRRNLAANPDNHATGFALYRRQMEQGREDDALLTVRHFTDQKNCPPYFFFLEAEGWAAKEDWERAWRAWDKSQTKAQ